MPFPYSGPLLKFAKVGGGMHTSIVSAFWSVLTLSQATFAFSLWRTPDQINKSKCKKMADAQRSDSYFDGLDESVPKVYRVRKRK